MHFESHNTPDLTAENRPLVTVYCAVWHKQPNKLDLLRSHWENLKSQSIPVEPCYIFDNGDQAPDWLEAPWHSFSKPLTIYEAWSAGVALTQTRYVMNLNMDDRLAIGGAQSLLEAALVEKAALTGGEWQICFDKAHLTQAFPVTSIESTEFFPDWPPRPHDHLRLGSGTGERGTFGPATLWDLQVIGKWYPSYFGNGDPILSIGDSIFWEVLGKGKLKMVRRPIIVGRYYSDPEDQAEFRPHQDNELLSLHGISQKSFADAVMSKDFSWCETAETRARIPVEQPPQNKIEKASAELAAQYRKLFTPAGQSVAAE